jgi:outer membrane immunogenic protein
MKASFLAGVALGALTLASGAQSEPVFKEPAPVPRFSWTGCYAGANIGGGFNHSVSSDVPSNAGIIGGTVGTNGAGPMAGGQAGCNYQVSNFVLGLEGDADWAGLNGTSYDPFFSNKNVQTIHQRTDFLADVTGRVGYSGGSWLLYAKGGVAFTNANYGFDRYQDSPELTTPYSGSQSRTGWVIGGGVEWALWPNWSAKAEYLHYDFGSENLVVLARGSLCGTCNSSFTSRIGQTDDTFKLGVNYHFFTP